MFYRAAFRSRIQDMPLPLGVDVFGREYAFGPGINVFECPLKNPPMEVVTQGPEAVRNYFSRACVSK